MKRRFAGITGIALQPRCYLCKPVRLASDRVGVLYRVNGSDGDKGIPQIPEGQKALIRRLTLFLNSLFSAPLF